MNNQNKVRKERRLYAVVGIFLLSCGFIHLWMVRDIWSSAGTAVMLQSILLPIMFLYGGVRMIRISRAPKEVIERLIKTRIENAKSHPPAKWWGYWGLLEYVWLYLLDIYTFIQVSDEQWIQAHKST